VTADILKLYVRAGALKSEVASSSCGDGAETSCGFESPLDGRSLKKSDGGPEERSKV
jgi:hypothetical protein